MNKQEEIEKLKKTVSMQTNYIIALMAIINLMAIYKVYFL